MPKSTGTYLGSPSAASETFELRATIAVLAQRLDDLTDRVNQLDPQWKNEQALAEQRESLAARNRQIAAEAKSYEQSVIQADAGRAARDIHERTLLASERSISKLYESGGLTPHTYGAQETAEELKRLGWSD